MSITFEQVPPNVDEEQRLRDVKYSARVMASGLQYDDKTKEYIKSPAAPTHAAQIVDNQEGTMKQSGITPPEVQLVAHECSITEINNALSTHNKDRKAEEGKPNDLIPGEVQEKKLNILQDIAREEVIVTRLPKEDKCQGVDPNLDRIKVEMTKR